MSRFTLQFTIRKISWSVVFYVLLLPWRIHRRKGKGVLSFIVIKYRQRRGIFFEPSPSSAHISPSSSDSWLFSLSIAPIAKIELREHPTPSAHCSASLPWSLLVLSLKWTPFISNQILKPRRSSSESCTPRFLAQIHILALNRSCRIEQVAFQRNRSPRSQLSKNC